MRTASILLPLTVPAAGVVAASLAMAVGGPLDWGEVARPWTVWLVVSLWGMGKVVIARIVGWRIAVGLAVAGVAVALLLSPCAPLVDAVYGTAWAAAMVAAVVAAARLGPLPDARWSPTLR